MDLKSGYWQVAMDPKDKEKTAFACHKGLFEFNVMPFGLTNAPGIFQQLMATVLEGFEHFATAYLDDIIIWSSSAEEHVKQIQQVFNRLRNHNLKLKLKNVAFSQQKQITKGSLSMNMALSQILKRLKQLELYLHQ